MLLARSRTRCSRCPGSRRPARRSPIVRRPAGRWRVPPRPGRPPRRAARPGRRRRPPRCRRPHRRAARGPDRDAGPGWPRSCRCRPLASEASFSTSSPEVPVSAPAARPASAPIRVPAGTTAGAAVREAGLPTTGAEAVVVVRDAAGTLRDLAWTPDADADVEPVAADTDAGRSVIRHSAAHVLAQAVQQLHPEAKLGIGPPVRDGFYYDFDVAQPFTPDDLAKLESAMKKIIKSGQRFSRRRYDSLDEARKELADEPYKLELIDLKGGTAAETDDEVMEVDASGELTAYDNLHAHTGEVVWSDLCRGPHVPTTRYIPAFRLMRTAAAYWRGNEKNKQLQRVYGTAWESQEALEAHLDQIAEAERRDHRRLGAELDLFSFPDEIGSGLAVFHPKGGVDPQGAGGLQPAPPRGGGLRVRQHPAHHQGAAVRDLRAPRLVRRGHVPAHAARRRAERGRHGPQAGAGLLPQADELPHAQPDLPVARAQLPGAAAAAVRVRHRLPLREVGRGARADPRSRLHAGRRAHLLHARPDAGRDPVAAAVRARTCCATTAWTTSTSSCPPATRTSRSAATRTGSGPPRRCGRPRRRAGWTWCSTRAAPRSTRRRSACRPRTRIGRTWQMSTIQVDLMLPDRFDLHLHRRRRLPPAPVMIHRALFGSIERFFGVLTEHYAGAFPAWLAPVQAVAIPVTGEQVPFVEGGGRRAAGAGHPRRGRRGRRPDAEEDPHPHPAEGAVPAARRGHGTPRPVRSASGSATGPSSTGCRWSPPSPRSSTGSGGGRTLAGRRGVHRPGRRAGRGPLADQA